MYTDINEAKIFLDEIEFNSPLSMRTIRKRISQKLNEQLNEDFRLIKRRIMYRMLKDDCRFTQVKPVILGSNKFKLNVWMKNQVHD